MSELLFVLNAFSWTFWVSMCACALVCVRHLATDWWEHHRLTLVHGPVEPPLLNNSPSPAAPSDHHSTFWFYEFGLFQIPPTCGIRQNFSFCHSMAQQPHFWAVIPRNWNRDLKRDICIPILTEALFAVAELWKQPKCPLADRSIKKMWCRHTTESVRPFKRTFCNTQQHGWTLRPFCRVNRTVYSVLLCRWEQGGTLALHCFLTWFPVRTQSPFSAPIRPGDFERKNLTQSALRNESNTLCHFLSLRMGSKST